MKRRRAIIKGFNHGYELGKHKPDLASQIQNGIVDDPFGYFKAFQAGQREYLNEISKCNDGISHDKIQQLKSLRYSVDLKGQERGKDRT